MSELTTIATFANPAEASPVRTTLEENGIRTYLQGETTADVLGHVGTAIGGVQLQVASTDVAKALERLGWSETSPPETPIAAWTCGSCGEKVDAGFEVCWNCGAAFDEPARPRDEQPEPPIDEEQAIVCPMCGEKLPSDTEECRHCGERLDGVSYDDPLELDDEGNESEELRRTREVLGRAYRSAIYGLFMCPPLVTVYAALLLAEYNTLRAEYNLPVEWRARVAMFVNILALCYPVALVFIYLAIF